MKCFWKDSLPSSYSYYFCASFCFIFYRLDTKKHRSHVNGLLFASWHLLKSIICFQYKRNTNKQNNGHKHWVYFWTISTELSHLKTRLFFGLFQLKNNKHYSLHVFNIINFLSFWHTFILLYWFKITCRTGKRTSINYKTN